MRPTRPAGTTFRMRFLRDNWLWILVPFVLIAALVLYAYLTTADSVTPFSYAFD